MILLRQVFEKDLDMLLPFSEIPGFFNIPSDPEMLANRISMSMKSFKGQVSVPGDRKFIFVAEDTASKRVVGTSMIASQHGTPDSPHFYFEVASEEKFSETIGTGFIHGTLLLKYDVNGPSEIGGLAVSQDLRNIDAHLGRQISFVRFLFLGLNRELFQRQVIAELMPPLNKKGLSPLWEAIGRRFTNMNYWEADELCQKNKEFILSLFPTGKLYTSFLSVEARNAIGKVGKKTEPVVHMLKKIGFKYTHHVDPFDGGPHFWAEADEIVPARKMARFKFSKTSIKGQRAVGLVSSGSKTDFKAVSAEVEIIDSHLHILKIVEGEVNEALDQIGISDGQDIVFMPYY